MLYYLPTGFFMMQQFMQIRQGFAIPLVIYGSVLYLSGKNIFHWFFYFGYIVSSKFFSIYSYFYFLSFL